MKEKNVRSDAILFTFFIRCQEANLILEIKKQTTQGQGGILHHYFT